MAEGDLRRVLLDPNLGREGPSADLFDDGLHSVAVVRNPFGPGELVLEKKDGAKGVTGEIMERAMRVVHDMGFPANGRQGDLLDCHSVARVIKQKLGDIADGIEVKKSTPNIGGRQK